MPQAQIRINAVVGSNANLPINTLVTLDNNNVGGETTYAWSILSQPEGPVDALSAASGPSVTFTPKKEGTYLVQLVVNGTLTNRVVAAVRQMKTNLRVPAAGETLEASLATGWAVDANRNLQALDTERADSGVITTLVNIGPPIPVLPGTLVQIITLDGLKIGLPGQEVILACGSSISTPAEGQDQYGIVLGSVATGGSVLPGELARVRIFGLIPEIAITGAFSVGNKLYADDAGTLSATPGSRVRWVGNVIAKPSPTTASVMFFGTPKLLPSAIAALGTGDVLYVAAGGVIKSVPIGAAGRVLTSDGITPNWVVPLGTTLVPYIWGPVGSGPGGVNPPYTNLQTMLNAMVADGATFTNPRTAFLLPGTHAGNITVPQGVILIGLSTTYQRTSFFKGPIISGNVTLNATNQTDPVGILRGIQVNGTVFLGDGINAADEVTWELKDCQVDLLDIKAGNIYAYDCHVTAANVSAAPSPGGASLFMQGGTAGIIASAKWLDVTDNTSVWLTDVETAGYAYVKTGSSYTVSGERSVLRSNGLAPIRLADTAKCRVDDRVFVALQGVPSTYMIEHDGSGGTKTATIGKYRRGLRDFVPTAAMKFLVQSPIVVAGVSDAAEPFEQSLTAVGAINQMTTLARLFSGVAFAATLPPASGRTSGALLWVINRSAATTHSLAPDGADTINGSASALAVAPYESILLAVRNGETDWQVYSRIAGAAPPSTSAQGVDTDYSFAVGVVVGDAVYLSAANTVDKADATDGTKPCIGIVRAIVGPVATVRHQGKVTGFVGLTTGALYYLATTAGAITSTAPSTVGNIRQVLARAISTTELLLCPAIEPVQL
jgi:hypothetical protein